MIAPIEMKYTYVSAWAVNGGINLSSSRGPQTLYSSERCRFILTTDPDPDLEIEDRGNALGNLMLRAAFTSDAAPDFNAELQKVMEQIRAQRRRKGGLDTVLVAYGYGMAPVSLDQSVEKNGFIVAMNGVEKDPIKEAHREEVESMKLALGFENASPSHFTKLADGVYLINTDGKIIYSINISMSGRANVSTGLSEAGVEQVSRRFVSVHGAMKLSSVKRLYSQMAEYENDPLRAFLFGWSALEILIAKLFSEYEQSFVSPILDGPQAWLRGRFLERVRAVMNDKYRLLDKFDCVTSVLFAAEPESEVHVEAERFKRLKRKRDEILHGGAFVEAELPVNELAALLRKYVEAYLAQQTTSIPAAPDCR